MNLARNLRIAVLMTAVTTLLLGVMYPLAITGAAQLLFRDPNHGSAEQRRLSSLPAGHAQGYAQCFESYVADSYAAVDAYAGRGKVPDGLPTFADGLRAAAITEAVLESARMRAWVEVDHRKSRPEGAA